MAGALVPLALIAPLDIKSSDGNLNSRRDVSIRKAYNFAAVASLLSELLAVMWASVAVNQLTETDVKLVKSVWDLLQDDYSLHWSAVNAHSVLGSYGFAFCIGCRAYFHAGKGILGTGLVSLALSGLLLMTSIVNRAIEAGGGDGVHRYGTNVIALFHKYTTLLLSRASEGGALGLLQMGSLLVGAAGIVLCLGSIMGVDEK